MAVTITVTPDEANAWVDLTVNFTAGTVAAGTALRLERWVSGDVGSPAYREQILATWTRGSAAAETVPYRDAAIPLGLSLRTRIYRLYTALGEFVHEYTGVYLESPGCWLTYGPHPQATLPVELQAWNEDEIAARQTGHRVLRRADVVQLGDVWDLPSGTLTFLARDLVQLDAITAALTGNYGTVLLRTQPDSLIVSTSFYWFMPGRVGRRRLSGRSPDGRRLVDVDASGSVSFPALLTAPLPTLQQLSTVGATLFDVANAGGVGGTLYDVATVPV